VDDDAAYEIARRSRGTPRVANRLLRRVRDFALVKADGAVTLPVTREALRLLEVDERGLDEMDRRMLDALIQRYDGGPVGLQSLAVVLGEDTGTLEDVYEPFLVQEGFIRRTPRGREATRLAYTHLGLPLPARMRSDVVRESDPEQPKIVPREQWFTWPAVAPSPDRAVETSVPAGPADVSLGGRGDGETATTSGLPPTRP